MAVGRSDHDSGGGSSSMVFNLDTGVTVAAGDNLLMVVISWKQSGRTVSTVQWDPTGVDEALTQDKSFGLGPFLDVWILKNPTPGVTKDVEVTLVGGNGTVSFGAVAMDKADLVPASPFSDDNDTSGSGTDIDVDVNSAVGELMFNATSLDGHSGGTSQDDSQNELWDRDEGSSGARAAGAGYDKAGAAGLQSMDVTTANSMGWVAMAVSVAEEGNGGATLMMKGMGG